MRTRFLQLAALALAGLALTAFAFGGWAVITVDELPAGLVVGQPVKIGFAVRQHGMTLLDQLSPTLVAVDEEGGAPQVRSSAPASGGPGHYLATLTVPRAGDWTITIASGFLGGHVTLYPIAAVAAGTRPRTLEAPAQVGRRLFVAKGCVTCHVHDGVTGNFTVGVGPDLTPRRYQADYLRRLLADPSIARKPGQQFTMPALGLQSSEIDALVAFINAERR
jgi:mono/diheme cytochrome c family protein